MLSHDLDADTELELALIGHAQLLISQETAVTTAVDELRTLASGRGDLLANAAGIHLGAYLAAPQTSDPDRLLAGAMLALAGADADLIGTEIETVRRWTATSTDDGRGAA
jgi:hypothetical protein